MAAECHRCGGGGAVAAALAARPAPVPRCSPRCAVCCASAGTAIFTFPGGVELKEAFKAQLDAVGRGLSEEEVQAVSMFEEAGRWGAGACCGLCCGGSAEAGRRPGTGGGRVLLPAASRPRLASEALPACLHSSHLPPTHHSSSPFAPLHLCTLADSG